MNGIQMLNRLKLKNESVKRKSTLDLGTVEILDEETTQMGKRKIKKKIKVLICSGKSDSGTIDIFMEAGADDFLVKPIKESVLLEKVERLIGKDVEKFARLKTNLSIIVNDGSGDKKGTMVEISELSTRLDILDRLSDGSKFLLNQKL